MNIELTKQVAMEQLRKFFHSVPFFEEVVESKMIHLINSITSVEDICPEIAGGVLERSFTPNVISSFKGEAKAAIEQGLQGALVLLLYLVFEQTQESVLLIDFDSFLARYPCFHGLGEDEKQLLHRHFRNMMACAQLLIPAKQNKRTLLSICAMLEREMAKKRYHTGTGMTLKTSCRVFIYLKEAKLDLAQQTRLVQTIVSRRESKTNNRVGKSFEVPQLTRGQINALCEFPVTPEETLLSRKVSLTNERSESTTRVVTMMARLFPDVQTMSSLIGDVVQLISSKFEDLMSEGMFNLEAVKQVNEQVYLSRSFPGVGIGSNAKSGDTTVEKLKETIRAAAAISKFLLLQELPAIKLSPQYDDIADFLASYDGAFIFLDLTGDDPSLIKQEQIYLFNFANAIRQMKVITAGKLPIIHLLRIGERLEGSHNHYTTGGGISPTSSRRRHIIQREFGILDISSREAKSSGKKRARATMTEDESAATEHAPVGTKKRSCVQRPKKIDTTILLETSSGNSPLHSSSSHSSSDGSRNSLGPKLSEEQTPSYSDGKGIDFDVTNLDLDLDLDFGFGFENGDNYVPFISSILQSPEPLLSPPLEYLEEWMLF